MNKKSRKKTSALILGLIVIVVLTILGGALLSYTISENRSAQQHLEFTQAFWLAESGISQALKQLRTYYNYSGTTLPVNLGSGEYFIEVAIDGQNRIITSSGYVPSQNNYRVRRIIEARVSKFIPPGFYDYAIYAGGDLERKGNVTGKVIYAGTATGSYKDPQPTSETQDSSISPLALLDFNQLRELSNSQGNYHDANRLGGPFPASFWYTPPQNGNPGVPNVVFLEGNFTLKGNDEVAGFFVVGGETVYDATIAGTVRVDGCIYTRGNFTIKGGGGEDFNVKGVWVGGTTALGGSSVIAYDQDYMEAIKVLGINADVQIISWRETQNPF